MWYITTTIDEPELWQYFVPLRKYLSLDWILMLWPVGNSIHGSPTYEQHLEHSLYAIVRKIQSKIMDHKVKACQSFIDMAHRKSLE